jgi:hypothetical protein
MGTTLKLDMWQDERKVLLADLLNVLCPPRSLRWRIDRFQGVGQFPGARSCNEFCSLIRESQNGYEFTGSEFDEFVENLRDITEIGLVGLSGKVPILRIEGEDSTTWYVSREQKSE